MRHILIICLLILITFNFGMSQSNDVEPDLPEYKSMFIDFKNQVNLKETMEKR